MVAGSDPDCRDHILCSTDVLPLGELPATVWRYALRSLLIGW